MSVSVSSLCTIITIIIICTHTQVQWSFIEVDEDGERLVPYDMLSNYDIEMAYQ